MKKKKSLSACLFPVWMLLLLTACQKQIKSELTTDDLSFAKRGTVTDESQAANAGHQHSASTAELLKTVHGATSRFHATTQAIMAGYEPDDHCVFVPGQGGMGYHWVNFGLVDPVFDPLKPEVMLYATGPGGRLQLVAVEYIVINTGQTPPMFGNQPFDVGGTPIPAPHWSLHVWLYKHNPSGIFARFNPDVSCP